MSNIKDLIIYKKCSLCNKELPATDFLIVNNKRVCTNCSKTHLEQINNKFDDYEYLKS